MLIYSSEICSEYGSGVKQSMNYNKRIDRIGKLKDSELNRAIFSK